MLQYYIQILLREALLYKCKMHSLKNGYAFGIKWKESQYLYSLKP